ncbi:MAG: GNAT family N-acetyltransferase [Defluviitaleaceae bacterium]|nr:GNAT family N-acetyltransferase [Defluviitaleaceae bacterium]
MFNDYQILEVTNKRLKKTYTEQILRVLPDWFGKEDSLLEYVETVDKHPFWGVFEAGVCVGFASGMIHHERTGEIYVCGLHPDYHRKGLGRRLYETLENYFICQGCEYVMVKTLSPLHPDIHYAKTRKFYEAVGLKGFYTDHDIWGHENPCLIMLKYIGKKV